MKTERLPTHLRHYAPTLRGFRALKRHELRWALEILSELQRGSAYTPGYGEIAEAGRLLRTAQEKMSRKNWGRGEIDW